MLTLYQYLVQKLLPEQVEKELQGGAVAAAQRHGRFILPQNVNKSLELETFKSLDAFVGPQLSSIASAISEQCALHALQTAQLANSDNKFVYFNRLNLAFKTSSPLNKLIPSTTIKPEVLSIIGGMHADRQSLGNYGEIIIKTPDEYWITGKSSNEREFYVIIQEKNANLKEIAGKVNAIHATQCFTEGGSLGKK
ncbi:hypothetical protein MSG28_010300 [Choristoneura fumiferana]|uniref:Uncharacterized protein n=1 Tax=Choristoneura fumiferana TaxID=7141 RepID=A0ACC0KL90_CHOFU|nr:hypothetical protein MSG28_010300 [Choristoneura fumiferana]